MQTNASPEDRPERTPFFISAGNFFQFIRWMLIATLTGIVVGSVSTLFNFALKYAVDFRRSHLWVILLLPIADYSLYFYIRRSIMKITQDATPLSTASMKKHISLCA